jgi:hypothetical protein
MAERTSYYRQQKGEINKLNNQMIELTSKLANPHDPCIDYLLKCAKTFLDAADSLVGMRLESNSEKHKEQINPKGDDNGC